MQKRILIQAPILTRSGYGERSRDIAYALLKNTNYFIEIFPTNWGNTPWIDISHTEKGQLINMAITQTPTPEPDIFIQITIPNEFRKVGRYNIGITAGIETDLCAPDWIEGCNRMDTVS